LRRLGRRGIPTGGSARAPSSRSGPSGSASGRWAGGHDRDGQLADFKLPHQVTVVAALPRSTISKVNKAALRTFLSSSDPLEQAERNWLAEAAADPSGDAL
jgi:hypothetical protein